MYQAKNFYNPLLQLSDDLENGNVSLKDLYYDQLLVEFSRQNDADIDCEFSEEVEHDDISLKLASFAFTQNVMAMIKQDKPDNLLADVDCSEVDLTSNTAKSTPKPFIAVDALSTVKAPKTTVDVDNFDIPNVNYQQGQAFFSQAHTDELAQESDNTNYSTSANETATQVLSKEQESPLLSKMNILLAFGAFLVTLLAFNWFSSSSDNNGGFSTLASNQPAAQQPMVAQQTVPVAPGVESYHPVPITEGVQYISLEVVRPVFETDLTLTHEQAANLEVLISNFEVQKRLTSNPDE